MRTPLVIAAVVTVVAAAGAGGAVVVHQRAEAEQDRQASAAIDALQAGWTRRDVTGVPFADPKAAATLQPATAGLRATSVTVVHDRVTRRDDRADATLKVSWSLPYGVTWTYQVPTTATQQGHRWLIATPERSSYWHPELKPGLAMTLTRTPAERGDLLDRNGHAADAAAHGVSGAARPRAGHPRRGHAAGGPGRGEARGAGGQARGGPARRIEGHDRRHHLP